MILLRCLLLCLAAGFASAISLQSQDMLEVARTQMAAGLTEDARLLLDNHLARGGAGSVRARYFRALLASSADSAQRALLELAGSGEHGPEISGSLERLGDLAYASGRYSEAADRFKVAADRASDPETSRRSLVKLARARIKAGAPGEAAGVLRRAQALGEADHRGMVRYYLALAEEGEGNLNGAAENYLTLYLDERSPYQLAALTRLVRIYGAGDSRSAAQWRDRLAGSSGGTVFDPSRVATGAVAAVATVTASSGGWSVQLGAFSNRDRAQALASDVRRRTGLDAVVLDPRDDNLYRVRIVGLASQQDADRVETVLKRNRIQYTVIKPGG